MCIKGEVTDYDQSGHFLIHTKITPPDIYICILPLSFQVYFALNFWKNNITIHYYRFFPFSPNIDDLILSFPPWTNNCFPSQMCHTHKPPPVTHIIQSGGLSHDLTIYTIYGFSFLAFMKFLKPCLRNVYCTPGLSPTSSHFNPTMVTLDSFHNNLNRFNFWLDVTCPFYRFRSKGTFDITLQPQ